MESNLEVIKYAKWYLWKTHCQNSYLKHWPSCIDVDLNRSLQYLLCQYVDHTISEFEEVTRKDVANFIENWISAQGTSANHAQPIDQWWEKVMEKYRS